MVSQIKPRPDRLAKPTSPAEPRRRGPADPEKRFAKMIREGVVPEIRPDLGPCLVYIGASNGNGYGQFRYNDRNGYAHRYAWERVNGPIPQGMTIDHLCMNRACVRVEHLEVVSGVENYRRGVSNRKVCQNGHPLEGNRVAGTLAMCERCDREGRARRDRARWNKAGTSRDTRVRYDQTVVRAQIALVRAAESTIAQASRVIGCNPNYLGRRVWNETKSDVLDRDGHLCLLCGYCEAIDVHHRMPRGSGGSSRPEIAFGMANLMSLCRSCHAVIEGQSVEHPQLGRVRGSRAESERKGWLISRLSPDAPDEVPVWTAVGWVQLSDSGAKRRIEVP